MAGNDNTGRLWDPLAMQHALSVQEKQIRDNFVTEYLKDYDPFAATVRVGYVREVAPQYASQFMGDVYVQREISRRRALLPEDAKGVRKQRRHDVEELLWELARDKTANA